MTLTNKWHHFGKKFRVIILLFILCFSTSVGTGLSVVLSEHDIGVSFRKWSNIFESLHILSFTVTFLTDFFLSDSWILLNNWNMQVILRNDKNCSKLRVVFADVLNSLCLEIASQGVIGMASSCHGTSSFGPHANGHWSLRMHEVAVRATFSTDFSIT